MAVFPEHIHIEGEDRLLQHAQLADRYRHLMDGLLGVLILFGLLLVAAVVVVALM